MPGLAVPFPTMRLLTRLTVALLVALATPPEMFPTIVLLMM